MIHITPALLRAATGCSDDAAHQFAGGYDFWAAAFGISEDAGELAMFAATIAHESGALRRMWESLDYTPDRLLAVFGPRRISPDLAHILGRTAEHSADQRKIAAAVYGGAWGEKNLGNTEPGDGWAFRGCCHIQSTGRDNARRATVAIRKIDPLCPDFEAQPERRAEPEWAPALACWSWVDRGCREPARAGDARMVRRRINGGDVGLEDFLGRLAVAQKALSLHEEIDNVATNTLPAGDAPMPDQPLHQGDAMPISPMPAGDAEAPAAAGPSVGGPVASFLSAAGAIAAKVLAVSNPLAGALVGTLAPLVQDKLARELGRHTDRPEVAQQVAGALVQAAQHATGMDDPVDAVAAARRSPQAVAAVEASVLAELDKLSPLLDKLASYSAAEWAADEAGREAGSRRGAQPLDDLGRMLARAGLVLASTVVVAVFVFAAAQFIRAGKVDPEVWAAVMLVIGWATGKVSTLFDFRFGSSHGSAALDAARSTINRNRS